MNWGKATVLVLIAFVLFIGSMSFYMFKAPADDYDRQYYEDGLNFDHDYIREKQVAKDHVQPVITIDTCCIRLTFSQLIKGQVKFMRPSSDTKDTTFALENTNRLPIELLTKNIAKGKWQLVFEWKSNHKNYLYHDEIYIK
jgi:hypothetical protein